MIMMKISKFIGIKACAPALSKGLKKSPKIRKRP
jgi:hypothetical protein